MESGEGSQGRGKRRKVSSEEITAMTWNTIDNIMKVNERIYLHKDTQCFFYDMNSKGYEWLMPGWVAEERHSQSETNKKKRVYRYYYNPMGRYYKSRKLVLEEWEKYGLILIDK
ncbi:hypothetical protein Lal_00036848 [Lupinus albus]|uniref:Uncharacterized protein n=1 Tax=Lupinus albus TaxID=3870 RepID=A0A6A4PUD5_LUPAL|nr:hypothetical protein Lalb_Chr10g0091611 [Lupinus albus]KAF1888806.1 hypothetical protein Lal_00036848 [Lupinus albus]